MFESVPKSLEVAFLPPTFPVDDDDSQNSNPETNE